MKFNALLLSGVLACSATAASAVSISAQVTADNVYGLYVGTPSTLALVGSHNAWQNAESYVFEAQAGDYVYVAAWDFGGGQAFQGVVSNGATAFRSNAVDWMFTVVPATALPGWSAIDGPQPSLTALRAAVGSASWSAIGATAAHGASPWGGVVGDAATQWIWSDSLGVSSSDGQLVVFRTASAVVSAVPEPGRAATLLLGLAVVGLLARRRLT